MKIPLTEDTLRKLGGWQALQDARRLVEAGALRRIDTAAMDKGVLSGELLIGGGVKRVIFRWQGEREASAACACPMARRGLLCAHALALGVAACRGIVPGAPEIPSPSQPKATQVNAASKPAVPGDNVTKILPIQESDKTAKVKIRLPSGLRKNWEKGALPVLFLRIDENSPEFATAPSVAELLTWITEHLGRVESMPPALRFEGSLAAAFLQWWSAYQTQIESAEGSVMVRAEAWRPVFTLSADKSGTGEVCLNAVRPEGDLVAGVNGWILGTAGGFWVCPWPDWSVLGRSMAVEWERAARFGGAVRLSAVQFLRMSPLIQSVCDLAGDSPGLRVDSSAPRVILALDGTINEWQAHLLVDYGDKEYLLPLSDADHQDFPCAMRDSPGYYRMRHVEAEQGALQTLLKCGFNPNANSNKVFTLKGEDAILSFYASIGRRVPVTWEMRYSARLQRVLSNVEVARFAFHPVAGQGAGGNRWLEGELACATPSGLVISRADIQRLLRGGRGTAHSVAGKKVVLDLEVAGEMEEVWQDVGAVQTSPGRFKFAPEQAQYLRAMLGDVSQSAGERGEYNIVLDDSSAGASQAILRPYQRVGVAWLAQQTEHGMGAVLADDMGLGKTLQTLVFLEWQRRRGESGPALVVCPTSLLSNWRDEAQRFYPDWKVIIQHGPARKETWNVLASADLVLTTYALLGRDAEKYAEHTFRAVVLDEASLIRNPDAQIAKAAHTVRGKSKIALTGTPVENSARDLWSVFQFIQPGYLGSRQDFRQRFELPLANGDTAIASRLHKRLQPFFLRRLKTDVAKDLPARMELTEWCEMEGSQAELYNAILRESRDNLADTIKKQGFAKARVGVLTALLRLRQVCCDPSLVYEKSAHGNGADSNVGSAKRERFRELVREAVEGGHRVLVFSQFVGMLERLREDIESMELTCGWLTGNSVDRGEQVRRFQAGETPIFLLSLKAGGYGLTLTAADMVILYDPWWNPAVEAQAIDRAHRIGQAKVVTAYRLAVRGTVEEKILRLQSKKRELAGRMLSDDQALMEGLQEEDLRDLLGI